MSVNILLAWSALADSAGRRVREYKLNFDYHWSDVMPKILGSISEVVWQGFMFFSVCAGEFLSWVANPKWLNGLDSLYQNTVSKALGVVNPFVVGVAGFGILIIYMSMDKMKSTSSHFDSNDWNRVATAFALLGGISVLVANPFMILKFALGIVQAVVSGLAGSDTDDGNMSAFSVDAMIRQPTLIINYSGSVSEKCANEWSKTGDMASTCIEAGANNPGALTLILAMLSSLLGLVAFLFAVVSLYKFTKHLTISVIGFVSLSWVAAVSLFRRRQFDQLSKVFAISCGHMIMVFVIQIISLGLPTFMSRIIHEWGQTDLAILQMLGMIACYLVFTAFLISATSKSSALVQSLKADSGVFFNKMGSPGGGMNLSGMSFSDSMSATLNALNPYTQYRDAKSALTTNSFFNKITRGKFAEKGTGEDEAVDTATDAQRTVNLEGGKPKPTLKARFNANSGAFGQSNTSGLSPAHTPPTAGTPDAVARLALGASSGGSGVLEAEVLVPGANGWYNTKDGISADTLGRHFYSSNMQSDDPYIGGLTNVGAVTDEVDRLVTDVSEKMRGLESLNMFLAKAGLDASELHNLINSQQGSDNARWHSLMDALSDSNINMDTIRSAIESSAGVQAAMSKDATPSNVNSTNQVGQMLALMEQSRSRASSEARTLGRGVSAHEDDKQVQHVTNVNTVVNSVSVNVSPAASPGIVRNALRGGGATPGDVGITKMNHTCARSEAEIAFEEAQIELIATGKNVQLSLPDDDGRFDIRFSPDRPGHAVSPAFDVGFGDSIF